ncbi:unnamed protein product [Soboliphyme baturini]|uniref:IPPc domain-containing protein n=1 Tax=Soboliphyme baturini TaxID=241478 RepID=A0A183IQR6_9BILA|nr:unnamed protein product [Soboliphyme baturini]
MTSYCLFSYIFWFGDLNYRLRSDPLGILGISEIKRACQLIGLIFQEFSEGAINFLPTYKYDTGTDYWDTSDKCRAPAWCDRILYMGDNIRQLEYKSIPSIRLSDHKPTVDKQKYQKVYEAALRESDRIENEWLPQVSLDKLEVSAYSSISYLTIHNIGKVRFATIILFGNILSEKCVLDIQVLLEKEIVLHLNGGKDFFLSIHATYVQSCFGLSLFALSALTGPIRGVKTEKLIDLVLFSLFYVVHISLVYGQKCNG